MAAPFQITWIDHVVLRAAVRQRLMEGIGLALLYPTRESVLLLAIDAPVLAGCARSTTQLSYDFTRASWVPGPAESKQRGRLRWDMYIPQRAMMTVRPTFRYHNVNLRSNCPSSF